MLVSRLCSVSVLRESYGSGAAKYDVYRKSATTGWVKQATVTQTTFTQSNLTPGVQYTYTVRAVNTDGVMSYYDEVGVSGVAYA